MVDPVGDIIGEYRAFATQQLERLLARGIDIRRTRSATWLSACPKWDQYTQVRTLLERHAIAHRENVWNGRPISLISRPSPSRSSTAR